MSQRHPIQNDASMLITSVTRDRIPIFLNDSYAREAVETLYRVQQLQPFFLYGFVIMPDHCHFLMYVPSPGSISKIMNVYKSGVTFNIGILKLWQESFHIRCIEDKSSALAYINANPIHKGLSQTADGYPWSSASGRWDISSLDVP